MFVNHAVTQPVLSLRTYHQIRHLTAQEIWDYDARRIKELEVLGYQVQIVWECERPKPSRTTN